MKQPPANLETRQAEGCTGSLERNLKSYSREAWLTTNLQARSNSFSKKTRCSTKTLRSTMLNLEINPQSLFPHEEWDLVTPSAGTTHSTLSTFQMRSNQLQHFLRFLQRLSFKKRISSCLVNWSKIRKLFSNKHVAKNGENADAEIRIRHAHAFNKYAAIYRLSEPRRIQVSPTRALKSFDQHVQKVFVNTFLQKYKIKLT